MKPKPCRFCGCAVFTQFNRRRFCAKCGSCSKPDKLVGMGDATAAYLAAKDRSKPAAS